LKRPVEGTINRYYDPATGQFASVDPDIIETHQPFVYVGDDPTNSVDPSGLCVDTPSGHCNGVSTENVSSGKFVKTSTSKSYGSINTTVTTYKVISTCVNVGGVVSETLSLGPSSSYSTEKAAPGYQYAVNSDGSVSITPSSAVLIATGTGATYALYTAGTLIFQGITGQGLIEGSVSDIDVLAEVVDALGPLVLFGWVLVLALDE